MLIIVMGLINLSSFDVRSQPSEEVNDVFGYVYEENTTDPIKGVQLNLTFDDNDTFIRADYTNETGWYEFNNLTEGNYTIELSKQYYEDQNMSFNLVINETKLLNFYLKPLDRDGDGVPDKDDFDPEDPLESMDSDGDGVGDNSDSYPMDPTQWEPAPPPPDINGDDDETKDAVMGESDAAMAVFICIPIIVVGLIVIVLIVVGYTRLKSRRLLEHQTRNKIFEYVQNNPGVHYRGIMNELGLAMGVLTHHLNMLERQGYIKSLQDGNYRRFYPVDMKIDTDLLLTDPQQQILEFIKTNPGISQAQVANNLNMTKKTVYYNVSQLRDAGLVFVDKSGRESECFFAGET